MYKHNEASKHAKDRRRRKQHRDNHDLTTHRKPIARKLREGTNEATNNTLNATKIALCSYKGEHQIHFATELRCRRMVEGRHRGQASGHW